MTNFSPEEERPFPRALRGPLPSGVCIPRRWPPQALLRVGWAARPVRRGRRTQRGSAGIRSCRRACWLARPSLTANARPRRDRPAPQKISPRCHDRAAATLATRWSQRQDRETETRPEQEESLRERDIRAEDSRLITCAACVDPKAGRSFRSHVF